MQDFKKLVVWQKARSLTVSCYQVTNKFPTAEQFGLTSQIRRCAVSIMANIAEGCGRATKLDFKRFMGMAAGSLCELECHLILALDLKLIASKQFDELNESLTEVRKMLSSFMARLQEA